MTDDVKKLVEALQSYQQADEDGVMVLVSRQACDEAAATLTRLAGEREEWQDIASAPKDGALILCSTPLRGGEHSCESWDPKALWEELRRDAEGFYDKCPHLRSIPTHWRVHPAPPHREGKP